MFKSTHRRKDGTFVKDTLTEEFLDDADANLDIHKTTNPSSEKSQVEIEDEIFNKLMYGDEAPKRPLGYGYGVKRSDVFGLNSMLRKEGFNVESNNGSLAIQKMEKELADLKDKNKKVVGDHEVMKTKLDESNFLTKKMTTQFGQILDVLSTGKAPSEFLDMAKKVLHTTVSDASGFVPSK